MLYNVAWRSAWYHKRLLGVVLLASWLVAGFCALIPLFLDTFSETVSRRIVAGIRPEMATLALTNPQPFAPDAPAIMDRELGDMITTRISFSRAIGKAEFPQLGNICGYDYVRGERLTTRSRYAVTTSDHCYKLYSFAALPDLFRLVEGRWPEELSPEPPSSPLTMGEPQIEAVVTQEIADTAGFEVGEYLVSGMIPTRPWWSRL